MTTKRLECRNHALSTARIRLSNTFDSSSATLAAKQGRPQGCMISVPEVRAFMDHFADNAYTSYMRGTPAINHLPLLARYNMASSLAANARLLGMKDEFYAWDGISPMNKQGPLLGLTFQNRFAEWPASLQPTTTQLGIEHHPWIDCFPWPQLRDNLLKTFEMFNLCDEDDFCHDICDLTDSIEPLILVWGSPDDPRNWEVSDGFLRKWAWLLSGCRQVLISTNYWRKKRGEPVITLHLFANLVKLSWTLHCRS